jgi:hypothetical protein
MAVLFAIPGHFTVIIGGSAAAAEKAVAVLDTVAAAVLGTFPVIIEAVRDAVPVCVAQPLELEEIEDAVTDSGGSRDDTQRHGKSQSGQSKNELTHNAPPLNEQLRLKFADELDNSRISERAERYSRVAPALQRRHSQ